MEKSYITTTFMKVFLLFFICMGVHFSFGFVEERNPLAELTPDQVRAFLTPRQIRALSPKQISLLRPEQIAAFRPDQVKAMTREHFSALKGSQISAFTPDQIPSILERNLVVLKPSQTQSFTSPQIQAFSKSQINEFSSSDMLKFSADQIGSFTPVQLKWLDRSQVRALMPEYLRQMRPVQVSAFTPDQIRILHNDQIKALNPVQARALNKQQMQSLGESQLETLSSSQIRQTLKPEDVSKADFSQILGLDSVQANYLTSSQKANLIFNQFNALSLEQFQNLTPDQIRSISPKQLKALDTNKLLALTPEQIKALTAKQIQILKSKQLELLVPENMISKEKAKEMDLTEAGRLFCVDCVQTVLGDSMTDICLALINSPVCKDVPEEKQIQCGAVEGSSIDGVGNSIWGCLKFSVGEILSAMWELLKLTWANATDSTVREETAHQASQVMDSVKLYLSTEYEKAYEEAGFPKAARAAMAVAGSLSSLLYNGIVDKFAEDIQEWSCFNQQAKAGKVCEYLLYLMGGAYTGVKFAKVLDRYISTKKADKAKIEADKAKIEADKAEIEAKKAEIEAEKVMMRAKTEAWKSQYKDIYEKTKDMTSTDVIKLAIEDPDVAVAKSRHPNMMHRAMFIGSIVERITSEKVKRSPAVERILDSFTRDSDEYVRGKIAEVPINGPNDINQLRRLAEVTRDASPYSSTFDSVFRKVAAMRISGRAKGPEVEEILDNASANRASGADVIIEIPIRSPDDISQLRRLERIVNLDGDSKAVAKIMEARNSGVAKGSEVERILDGFMDTDSIYRNKINSVIARSPMRDHNDVDQLNRLLQFVKNSSDRRSGGDYVGQAASRIGESVYRFGDKMKPESLNRSIDALNSLSLYDRIGARQALRGLISGAHSLRRSNHSSSRSAGQSILNYISDRVKGLPPTADSVSTQIEFVKSIRQQRKRSKNEKAKKVLSSVRANPHLKGEDKLELANAYRRLNDRSMSRKIYTEIINDEGSSLILREHAQRYFNSMD